MKTVTARDIGEVIAVIEVIVSLIFIGLEFRQSTIASRAAAYQEMGIATSDALFALTENSVVLNGMSLMSQGLEVAQTLPPEEYRRTIQWMRGTLRLYETTFLQVELGLLEPEALDYLGWRNYRNTEWLRNFWPVVRTEYSNEFIEHLESSWAEN